MAAEAKPLVKGSAVFKTAEDDFIAAHLLGLGKGVVDESFADALPLKVLVDGNVFDVADAPAAVDEFLFDNERRRADNPAFGQCDIRMYARAESLAENRLGLLDAELDRGQTGKGCQEIRGNVWSAEFTNAGYHLAISFPG
jgi:hypothetical protein